MVEDEEIDELALEIEEKIAQTAKFIDSLPDYEDRDRQPDLVSPDDIINAED